VGLEEIDPEVARGRPLAALYSSPFDAKAHDCIWPAGGFLFAHTAGR
jgi:hypothetical protein